MPAYVAHSLFGRDVTAAITRPGLQQFLSQYSIAFEWGLQGPDLLFFSGMLPPRVGHTINRLGGVMHREKTDKLLNQLVQYLIFCKGKDCYNNVLAYALGFCCHYGLDSTAHPYVYYVQEQLKQTLPAPYHQGIHNKLESDIDSELCLIKAGETISDFTVAKEMIADRQLQRDIALLYQHLFAVVYNVEVDVARLEQCFGDAYRVIRLVLGRPFVLALAKTLDGIAGKRNRLSAHVRRGRGKGDPLNLSKKQWYHLTDGSIPVCSTYQQLEQQALTKTLSLLQALCNAVENGITNPFCGLESFDNGSPKS
ncbi:zinc dependent phospholipase C family protein [Hydrogenoanaerobacterium sp.]|uniref:zinc dependent phospholipase C family protein n=1 Tax=Hydrogenoanaerobacterium sp. TaxID=2953763 RepID=UPI002898B93B|nr:zinc dependent phospholipase C family protein [Hydrogenoanaerobacterium sp.]